MNKRDEVFNKTYGQIPKEVCWNGFFTYPEKPKPPRKIKLLFLELIRWIKSYR